MSDVRTNDGLAITLFVLIAVLLLLAPFAMKSEYGRGVEEGKKQAQSEMLKSFEDTRQVAVECLRREAERVVRCDKAEGEEL